MFQATAPAWPGLTRVFVLVDEGSQSGYEVIQCRIVTWLRHEHQQKYQHKETPGAQVGYLDNSMAFLPAQDQRPAERSNGKRESDQSRGEEIAKLPLRCRHACQLGFCGLRQPLQCFTPVSHVGQGQAI